MNLLPALSALCLITAAIVHQKAHGDSLPTAPSTNSEAENHPLATTTEIMSKLEIIIVQNQ